jgi:hypothetical protein
MGFVLTDPDRSLQLVPVAVRLWDTPGASGRRIPRPLWHAAYAARRECCDQGKRAGRVASLRARGTNLRSSSPMGDTLRVMRIGTWNLDTEWNADTKPRSRRQVARLLAQMSFIERANCDVWLLTEVPRSFDMAPGDVVFSKSMGASDKAYAAVWAKDGLEKLSEIHQTAAFARVGDVRVCSCVLPWRFAPSQGWPVKGDYAAIVEEATGRMREGLTDGPGDLVWGGDWNQALEGRDHVGTLAGRSALLAVLETLDLAVTTAGLHKHNAKGEHRSIDHIAVPKHWKSGAAKRLVAETNDGRRLSDHDVYIVDVEA